ncbi:MAG TPA: hypothetical protein DHN29_05560 [Cytophagales bacterium]|nr:hypothetical protein [Cytophagales bacterium]
MPSGHGIGKTWLSARLALAFLYSFYPSKIITTAPTWPQVETLLWGEIRKAHSESKIPLGGLPQKTKLELSPDWFLRGLSTTGSVAEREFGATRFQGFHSENLLVILDEAPGVEPSIWIATESLIVGDNNRILAIGNPTSPTGMFYDACRSPLWNKIQVSCYDHPNVKENRTVIPGAVTPNWIDERKQEWGEDSPLYKAKILGDFPDEGEDTLIPLSWAEDAMHKQLKAEGKRRLGCDVARFGSDKTVIFEMNGPVANLLDVTGKVDTMVTVGKIRSYAKDDTLIAVDDSGVGGGVTDRLRELEDSVDAVNFGERAIEPERFANLKAEAFWLLRERFKPNSPDPIQIPDSQELLFQLTSIKYTCTSKGQIKIESKEDMKKRGMKSPDLADALAICNYAGRRNKEPTITIL